MTDKNEIKNLCDPEVYNKEYERRCQQITKENDALEVKGACHNIMCSGFKTGSVTSVEKIVSNCLLCKTIEKARKCPQYIMWKLLPTDLKKAVMTAILRVRNLDNNHF